MSGSEDKDQKTQQATPKKLEDARKKGDVPMSPEMRQLAMFSGFIFIIGGIGAYAAAVLTSFLARLLENAGTITFEPRGAQAIGRSVLGAVAAGLMPMLGALFLFALIGGLAQGRPMISPARIAPKFSKINPVSGIKRMFGVKALVEFGKTLAKLLAVSAISLLLLWPFLPGFETMVGIGPRGIIDLARGMVWDVLLYVAILIAAIALFDILYQRQSFAKKMMMSLKEVKDEHKDQEGDPRVKGMMRQIGRQRVRRRMMAAVPDATVIITNPTHYAVALKYDHGSMMAPIVVAKGTDLIALKIREIAGEHRIPMVENRPLARALHANAEIDRPIPIEHYQAVAEVISYVLKLAREGRQLD